MYLYHGTEGLAVINGVQSGYGKTAVTSKSVKEFLKKTEARYIMSATGDTASVGGSADSCAKILIEAGFHPLGSRNNPVYGSGKHMTTLWLLTNPKGKVNLADFSRKSGDKQKDQGAYDYRRPEGGPWPFWDETMGGVRSEHDVRPLMLVPSWLRWFHCCGADFLWIRERGMPSPLPNPSANFHKMAFIYASPALTDENLVELRSSDYKHVFGHWQGGPSGWLHAGEVALSPEADKLWKKHKGGSD